MILFKKISAFLTLILVLISTQVMSVSTVYAGKCKVCASETEQSCNACGVAQYCKKECQTSNWGEHKADCQQWKKFKQLSGGVRFAESTLANAGRGLFAGPHGFERGQPVAVYAGRWLQKATPKKIASDFFQEETNGYLQSTLSGDYVVGSPDPVAPHLGAQMANDPYMDAESLHQLVSVSCDHLQEDYLAEIQAITKKYLHQVYSEKEKCNVFLDLSPSREFPPFISVRQIMPNEEIFYAYGLDYWLQIPIHICHRKGHPIEALRIQRAISAEIEQLNLKDKGRNSDFFSSFISDGEYHMYRESLSNSTFDLRLSSLLAKPQSLQFFIEDRAKFEQISQEIGLKLALLEIAHLPNSEFYDNQHWGKAHQKSKDLLIRLMTHTQMTESPGKASQAVFTFMDAISGKEIPFDQMLAFLRSGI